jgi:hypothetical protein
MAVLQKIELTSGKLLPADAIQQTILDDGCCPVVPVFLKRLNLMDGLSFVFPHALNDFENEVINTSAT